MHARLYPRRAYTVYTVHITNAIIIIIIIVIIIVVIYTRIYSHLYVRKPKKMNMNEGGRDEEMNLYWKCHGEKRMHNEHLN